MLIVCCTVDLLYENPTKVVASGSRSRSSRTSPYGKTSPITGRQRVRDVNCELDAGDIECTYIGSSVASVNASKYMMKGALVTPLAEQQSPKSPARGDKTTPGGKATWGEWLQTLVPESVKKVAVNGPVEVEESQQKTFSIPGGFYEIPLVEEVKPIVEEKRVVRKRSGYINPQLAMKVYTDLPPKSSFWPFDDSIFTSGKYRARPPFHTSMPSASVAEQARSANVMRRGRAILPPARQQSSVPSKGGYKRVRRVLMQPGLTDEDKNRIAEERLMELEMIAADRRVKMREDAFEKRLLLAQLGRSPDNDKNNMDVGESQTDDDRAMEDADKPAKDKLTKDKGKAKQTTTTELSKSHETARPVSKPSSFLFGGSAYDPSCAPPRPNLMKPHEPRHGLSAPEAKKKKTLSFAAGTKPPAPPTQAKPPKDIAPTGTENLPPSTQRSQTEKYKPHVSIGLRSSTTMWSNSRSCASEPSNIAPSLAKITMPGPVRNVQKKRSGYGLYYSSDDEDEEMPEAKPAPQKPSSAQILTPGPVQIKVEEPKKRSGYGFYYSDYSGDEDEKMPEPNQKPSSPQVSAPWPVMNVQTDEKMPEPKPAPEKPWSPPQISTPAPEKPSSPQQNSTPAPDKPSSPPQISAPELVMNVQTEAKEPNKQCGFHYSDDSNEEVEKIPEPNPPPQKPSSPPKIPTPGSVMNVQTKAKEGKQRCGFNDSDAEDEKMSEPKPLPHKPSSPPQIPTPGPVMNVQTKAKEPKNRCGFYYSDDSDITVEKMAELKLAPEKPSSPPQIPMPGPVMNVQTKAKEPKNRCGFYYSDDSDITVEKKIGRAHV